MEIVEITDAFDCARLAKGTQIRKDDRVEGDAFALRKGESYLSMNCLDLLDGDRSEQLDSLRAVLDHKLNVSGTARLAIINVGGTKRSVLPHSVLNFVHEPETDDESHCGMYGLEYNNELVQDLIAESVVDVVKARR